MEEIIQIMGLLEKKGFFKIKRPIFNDVICYSYYQ